MKGARSGGGYWIGPEEADPGLVPPPQAGTRPSVERRPPAPTGPRRRHVMFWTGLSLVVLLAVGILAALVLRGDILVPGLSAKLFPIHYQSEIAQAAEKYDQDPYLVAAMVKTESGYDATAESGSGAVGLMQLMPATAEWVASKSKAWPEGEAPVLTDPVDSLELGVWYLAYLGDIYGVGSLATLAAYNGGLGNVDEWIEQAGGLESFQASDIQFGETRDYVERIERYLDLYKRVHPDVFTQASE